eukprot:CAMPEP_0184865304 /NCGR_PEP_ID=MMETSP0580-20130426/17618_1 /TAXON_ID=1118495 /ORGANISM="Dactyliosolen fragilissimus" /LENGTH=402 /DNA_ID=CAMNT_0027364445 /DNA_START=45 /DNA_END=1253 /DNA_ORIENTATION=+
MESIYQSNHDNVTCRNEENNHPGTNKDDIEKNLLDSDSHNRENSTLSCDPSEELNYNLHEGEVSNEYVLNFAFFTFFFFMLTEAFFAITIARSEAMLADAMAMSVDAFTYLFNMVAERLKHFPIHKRKNISFEEASQRRQIFVLYLELIPPLISVSALIIVSAFSLKDAIKTILRLNPAEPARDEPNINMMLLFSALNLILDILNVTCFQRVEHFSKSLMKSLGIDSKRRRIRDTRVDGDISETTHLTHGNNHSYGIVCENDQSECSVGSSSDILGNVVFKVPEDFLEEDECLSNEYPGIIVENDIKCKCIEGDSSTSGTNLDDNDLNLNMCSAYTHVMADTLRSIAVLITATIAHIFTEINPAQADASACIIVSLIILFSLGPLFVGMSKTISKLRALTSS